jgi:lipopolysaccharide heptosyltransferase II
VAQAWVPTLRRRVMLAALDAIARVARLEGRPPENAAKSRQDVRRILVVEPKNIGDVVLTLPFLAHLRAIFPQSTTTLLAQPFARTLLEGTDLVDEFIGTNLGWSAESTRYNPLAYNWRELWRLKRELPERHFDLAFKACMHIREHIVLGLSGGKRRIAYAFGQGDGVLTDAVVIDNPDRHKAADWLHLLESFGEPVEIETPRLRVSESERRWAAEYLLASGISPTVTVIGIHPGASVPEKRWPLDRFRKIAEMLTQRRGTRVLALVDPEGYGASLSEVDGVVTVKVGLREMMALIERCELLVCNDSGPMHIAGALGVPTVAIFGTGINLWFAPLGDGHRLITGDTTDTSKAAGGQTVRPYDLANILTSRVLAELDSVLPDHP